MVRAFFAQVGARHTVRRRVIKRDISVGGVVEGNYARGSGFWGVEIRLFKFRQNLMVVGGGGGGGADWLSAL